MTSEVAAPAPHSPVDPSTADDRIAIEIATAAGQLLTAHRAESERSGVDAVVLRSTADRLSHEFLVAELGRLRPSDAVLSEEGADDSARLTAKRVWIVDPLDGTREFGEPGRTDWAVHVALVEDGELVTGAVALPALGIVHSSTDVPVLTAPIPTAPRIAVSRTRRPEPILALAAELGGELVAMGSAGAKAMAVVRGDVDVYAHTGGQYEWDSAAPVAVARAAGMHVSRLDGSALIYNRPDPWLPDLLICRPELAGTVLEVLRR